MIKMEDTEKCPVALHVVVVGFHHKKGMVIEYAYPPFSNNELPDSWKHLPSLCLPDGAHNHEADTIYFNLPHLTDDQQTVFGVSCYRQIDAEKIPNKTADITRNTVQKSVCVLTTLPIYGYIQERLRVTTKVYFKEADFSDVRDLEGLYHDLNTTNWRDKLMHGICVSDAARIFGRNLLILFKLLLLEKKLLFFHSPVGPLVKTITSLLTLLPGTLPDGLSQAAASRSRFQPLPERNDKAVHFNSDTNVSSNLANALENDEFKLEDLDNCAQKSADCCEGNDCSNSVEKIAKEGNLEGKIINVGTNDDFGLMEMCGSDLAVSGSVNDDYSEKSNSSLTSVTSRGSIMSPQELNSSPNAELVSQANLTSKISSLKGRLSGAFTYWTSRDKSLNIDSKPSATVTPNPSPSEPGDDPQLSPTSGTPLLSAEEISNWKQAESDQVNFSAHTEKYALLENSLCGLPLQLFAKGNVVHPYLSLQYLDVLNEPTTRAFTVGASNSLFVHKKNLYDVLVELEGGKIQIIDPELKKQLNLSIEDLRFAENITRQVEAVNATKSPDITEFSMQIGQPDVFLEGIGWMGGEEWLRHQFKIYLLAMLRSSTEKTSEMFNGCYVSAWKQTHNYRVWSAGAPYEHLDCLPAGHPNAGTLSMADMRIRLSQTIQGLDRNKRLNQTLASTGTAVVKTKEAVGGALTTAKGAIANLWSSFTTQEKAPLEEGIEVIEEVGVEAISGDEKLKTTVT